MTGKGVLVSLVAAAFIFAGCSAVAQDVYQQSLFGPHIGASMNLPAPSGGAPISFDYYNISYLNLNQTLVYRIGGAATTGDGHIWTKTLCDDLTYTVADWPPFFSTPYIVDSITAAFNSTMGNNHFIGVNYKIYDSDGSHQQPGTLLYSYGLVQRLEAGSGGPSDFYSINRFINYYFVPPIFTLHPRSDTPLIWACMSFDNLGDPANDLDVMNNLGVVLRAPVQQVGSSEDLFFVTDQPKGNACPDTNPDGSIITNFHYSMYWQLRFDNYQFSGPGPFDRLWNDGFDRTNDNCGYPYIGG